VLKRPDFLKRPRIVTRLARAFVAGDAINDERNMKSGAIGSRSKPVV
jgi:hypothetical protein